MDETPTNQQLYELLQVLGSRVEDMDGDHSAQLRNLTKQLNEQSRERG
jgi:hypothetical protein